MEWSQEHAILSIKIAGRLMADVERDIDRVLSQYRTVAIVGASSNPERDSYTVAKFLKEHGWRMIPVTPNADEVLGEAAYPDLTSVPEPVEVVDIFRRPEDVPPLVEQAVAIGAKVVWMQEGIVNEAAAARAREAGLTVVMDRCMRKETLRRIRRKRRA